MAIQETLINLRDELADARAARREEAAAQEAELVAVQERILGMAATLQIKPLLQMVNAILLEGRGTIEQYNSWDEEEEVEVVESGGSFSEFTFTLNGGDEEDYGEVVCFSLFWQEGGECNVDVDLGTYRDELRMMVNGLDVPVEREALEQAVVDAFRAELAN